MNPHNIEGWLRRLMITVASISLGFHLQSVWAATCLLALLIYVNGLAIGIAHAFQQRAHELRYTVLGIREELEEANNRK